MIVVTAWCEWDVGLTDAVFASMEVAKREYARALEACCIEESVEELLADGMLGFQLQKVIE